jgi:peptidyl-tRNA hydrolase
MKVVIGAGTPGDEYQDVRNNAGFRVCDALATELGVAFVADASLEADVARAETSHGPLLIVKPRVGYDRIGVTFAALIEKHSLDAADALVVYDEYHLPLGVVDRTNESGGGVNAAIQSLNSHGGEPTQRVRIGIGSRLMGCLPPEEFATKNFSSHGLKALKHDVVPLALDEIHSFVTG